MTQRGVTGSISRGHGDAATVSHQVLLILQMRDTKVHPPGVYSKRLEVNMHHLTFPPARSTIGGCWRVKQPVIHINSASGQTSRRDCAFWSPAASDPPPSGSCQLLHMHAAADFPLCHTRCNHHSVSRCCRSVHS